MGLFVCDQCDVIENTATSRYWFRDRNGPALCSQCDPEVDQWHGCFERVEYDPTYHVVKNRPNPQGQVV